MPIIASARGVESLASRLIDDLAGLSSTVPTPNVLVLSGDITEWARPQEFTTAFQFVSALQECLGIDESRTILVPGNHDINRDLAQAYFLQCSGTGLKPELPYYPKWQPYADFISQIDGQTSFTPERPYSLKAIADLKIVFAQLNSTMHESHLPEDHYGWCGETQLRWFKQRLQREYTDYLRIGVLHHNVRAQAGVIDEEKLRDDDDLIRFLAPSLDLVLHGHTHDGKSDLLPNGTLILATGSTAVAADWRPGDVGNQYQILNVADNRVTRWTRVYQPRDKRWVADTTPSDDGASWKQEFKLASANRMAAAQDTETQPSMDKQHSSRASSDAFLNDIRMVTLLERDRKCLVEKRTIENANGESLLDYLVIAAGTELYVVGAFDEQLSAKDIDLFNRLVHQPFRQKSPMARSVLVHTGRADRSLKVYAKRLGIDALSWAEYQHLLDLSAYAAELADGLRRDPLYPQELYLDQRYRDVDRFARVGTQVKRDLAAEIEGLVLDEDQRFALILGHAGYGKSFLLRRVALRLVEGDSGIIPILVRLRDLERSHSLAEMVSQTVTS